MPATDISPDPERADPPENLPVVAQQKRTYLRIRPTDDSLQPATILSHFRRLHRLLPREAPSLFGRLRGTDTPPTIECLLIASGTEKPLSYLFGVDDADAFDGLERTLRGMFPDSFEIERITQTQNHLDTLRDGPETPVTAIEFCGQVTRRKDWQTRLTPFASFIEDEQDRVPLAAVVETMADASAPMVYQVLIQPKPDWSSEAEQRQFDLENHQETLGDQLVSAIVGPPEDDLSIPASDEQRIVELTERDARRSFVLNVRLVAIAMAQDPDPLYELTPAFSEVGHTVHEIVGRHRTSRDAVRVFDAIRDRTFYGPEYQDFTSRLPWKQTSSRGIVADATEAPSFCVLDGPSLTASGTRAMAPTPKEQTALALPPESRLVPYRRDGFLLGHGLTQDGIAESETLSVPPELQSLHLAIAGRTGAGKTNVGHNATLENHAATDGLDLAIMPKGEASAYLRAHYARFGNLDNVLYFDCARHLPAISFFDIRDDVEAGVPRATAVEGKVDHYIEILQAIMGRERFDSANRSPDVIQYVLKAMYDPVHGSDSFGHHEFHSELNRMADNQRGPAVSDAGIEESLAGITATDSRMFKNIMAGVSTRVEKILVDRRLGRVFNHTTDGESDRPEFDFASYLNEDMVIIFDMGDLRNEAQRVLTLLLLSNLWSALRRRTRRHGQGQPLVNCYIEEAPSIAASDMLTEFLSQSRGFDCSMALFMQYPAQLRAYGDDVYDEVLNNIATFLTGNIPADRRLAERLATDELSPTDISNRLRALRRGQWLASLPAAFGDPEPRPFVLESHALPPGHPDGPNPLSTDAQVTFEAAIDALEDRTLETAGLTLAQPGTIDQESEEADEPAVSADTIRTDSALPHTKRLPPTVQYVESVHALQCRACETRYDPDLPGMKRAIGCCSTLAETDRDDIPICGVHLKLTPEEREESPYSDTQLLFVQAVYNAQQLRYDRLEYDLRYDSMLRLQEYIGIENETIDALIDDDVLRQDGDHPHRLYSVSPAGRTVIGERYRLGVDYGHGLGDLEESSQHVLGILVGIDMLEAQFVENPESEAVEVSPYHDLDPEETLSPAAFMADDDAANSATEAYEQRRLDIAALDAEGNVVVAVEVERVNNDIARAVPDDFDKMAACGVEEAIWIVMTQSAGHKVLQALNDPPEGAPRVEKTYASTTPPQQFRIETPGLTAIYPAAWLRDSLAADE
jgi:DNA helicase HerA-like ATPase